MIWEVKCLMKYIALTILAGSLLVGAIGDSREPSRPIPVKFVEILASPQAFEGKQVVVRAFLLIAGGNHDIAYYSLSLSKEDAENALGNSVMVVPNEEMHKNPEKFDRMFVSLTGSVRTEPAVDGGRVTTIKDVTECKVWSDPNRPIIHMLDRKVK
jgi:hypothetical protein